MPIRPPFSARQRRPSPLDRATNAPCARGRASRPGKGRLHPTDRDRPGRTRSGAHRLDHALQRPVPRPPAALQGRAARGRSTSTTTPTRPNLCTGTARSIPSDVDGAAEEGTPYIPPHGMRRISFVPKPTGFRFYHTHVVAGGDLNRGTYTGQVGPVYIEPKNEPGAYDREVFLVLKEFEPSFSRGGDMAMDFLAGEPIKELEGHRKEGRRRGTGEGQGLRSRLRPLLDQRQDAWPWRAHPRQARRTRAVSRPERQRWRDPEPRAAGAHVQSRCARRQSRADAARTSRCSGSGRPSASRPSSR